MDIKLINDLEKLIEWCLEHDVVADDLNKKGIDLEELYNKLRGYK